MKSHPSLLLLDVGEVLLRLRSWKDILDRYARSPHGPALLAATGSAEALLAGLDGLHSWEPYLRFELGQLTEAQFLAAARRDFRLNLSDEILAEVYGARIGPAVEGMERLVQDAKAAGLRVAGFSNTTPIHTERIFDSPVVRLLDRLVTSCDIGLAKPDPEAYRAALVLLEAKPEETLFVDDREDNVAGARAAGLSAIVFRGADQLRAELGI